MMSTTSNIAIKRSPDGELIIKSKTNDDDLTSILKNIILFFVNVFCVWPVSKFFEIVTSVMYVIFSPFRITLLVIQAFIVSLEAFISIVEGINNGDGVSRTFKRISELPAIRSLTRQVKEILDDLFGYTRKPIEDKSTAHQQLKKDTSK